MNFLPPPPPHFTRLLAFKIFSRTGIFARKKEEKKMIVSLRGATYGYVLAVTAHICWHMGCTLYKQRTLALISRALDSPSVNRFVCT